MAGTKEGGLKARDKNLANDPDFYVKLGRKGGRASSNSAWARTDAGQGHMRRIGRVGGLRSRHEAK